MKTLVLFIFLIVSCSGEKTKDQSLAIPFSYEDPSLEAVHIKLGERLKIGEFEASENEARQLVLDAAKGKRNGLKLDMFFLSIDINNNKNRVKLLIDLVKLAQEVDLPVQIGLSVSGVKKNEFSERSILLKTNRNTQDANSLTFHSDGMFRVNEENYNWLDFSPLDFQVKIDGLKSRSFIIEVNPLELEKPMRAHRLQKIVSVLNQIDSHGRRKYFYKIILEPVPRKAD